MSTRILEPAAPDVGSRQGFRADAAAGAVIAVGLGGILLVAQHAFLRGDDWLQLGVVSDPGFGPASLLRPNGNHLSPVGFGLFAVARMIDGPAPWDALIGFGLLAALVALVFTWLCIRHLVGPVLPAVACLVPAACSPALLSAVVWPAVGVLVLPAWAATAIALYGHLRSEASQSRRWQVLVLIAGAAGLLCSEQAVLIGPTLFLVSMFWYRGPGLWAAAVAAWRSRRTLWLGMIALVAAYLAVYVATGSWAQTLPESGFRLDVLVASILLIGLRTLPSLLLDLVWQWSESVPPLPMGPPWLLAVTAGVAWWFVWQGRRRGWGAWIPLAGYFVLTVLLLAVGRLTVFGPGLALNPYYYVAGVTLLSVTLAVGFLPSRLPVSRRWQGYAPPRWVLPALAVVALLAATGTASAYAAANPSRSLHGYLEQVRQSLDSSAAPLLDVRPQRELFSVYDRTPPWDTWQNLGAMLDLPDRWVDFTEELLVLDSSGRIVPGVVDGGKADLGQACLPVSGLTRIPMPVATDPQRQVFALTYRADAVGEAQIRAGGQPVIVPILPGRHTVYVAGRAGGEHLDIDAGAGGPDLCISRLVVGEAVPASA